MAKESEYSYQEELDNKLSEGEQPHKKRPFTLEDKVKVIIKIRSKFSERDCHILNSFCSSKRDREHTTSFHDVSPATLYRLLKEVDKVFEPPESDKSASDSQT